MKDLKKRRRAQGEQARAELLVRLDTQIMSVLLVTLFFFFARLLLNLVQSGHPGLGGTSLHSR